MSIEINATINFKHGAKQSLSFLKSVPFIRPFFRANPSQSLSQIPLTSYSYSCSLGVSPSSGTVKASGKFISRNLFENANLEDVSISIKASGSGGVNFKSLKVVDFTYSPISAPPGGDRVYTINFQDARWRLQNGGIYGYFNRVVQVQDDEEFEKVTLNPDTEEPWTYLELIKKAGKQAGVNIGKTVKTRVSFGTGPKVTLNKAAFSRLDEFPLNKDYRGQTPAQVISELIGEINFTLSITPEGGVFLCPLSGTTVLSPQQQPLGTSAGAKYKPIPDRVYLVGGRVRDQIKIEPNTKKMEAAFKSALSGGRFYEYGAPGTVEGENPHGITMEDLGLEPVCKDITGRIRNFYDLLKTWDVDLKEASMVYQHKNDSEREWQKLFVLLASREDIEEEEREIDRLKGLLEQKKREAAGDEVGPVARTTAADEVTSTQIRRKLKKTIASVRRQRSSFMGNDEYTAGTNLYPEEEEFLAKEENKDYDVLTSKVTIARKWFFKLYRIPEKVKVNYIWDGELKDIREKFAPNAPEGEQEVPRSYVLPFVELVDETEHEEAEKKQEAQKDKGKSKSEKKGAKKKAGALKKEKRRNRFRVWSYAYHKIAGQSPTSFGYTELKEHVFKASDVEEPEPGLLLLHRAPYVLEAYEGFSEDVPFIPYLCPVGCEFTYERKDPELDILNFFITELDAPGDIKGSPPSREEDLVVFEQVAEFVEHLKQGESIDGDKLVDVAWDFADEIWHKRVGTESGQTRSGVAVPISAYPIGPLQCVSWTSRPCTTMFEASTDYQAVAGTTLTGRIKRALGAAGLSAGHRSPTIDQEFLDRRGFWSVRRNEKFEDDERRLVTNSPHGSARCLFDPKQEEDVSFISAVLVKEKGHHHSKFWLGPILCRPHDQYFKYGFLQKRVPLFGHLWWTWNVDLAGCGHAHKIGGYYYPWVYDEPEFNVPPVKNPISEDERKFIPETWYIEEVKVEVWNDPGGSGAGKSNREKLTGEGTYVPQTEGGTKMVLGLLVEYCVPDIIVAPTTATFYAEARWYGAGQTINPLGANPPHTGSGFFVLPIPAGEALLVHRHLLCSFTDLDNFDNFEINLYRSSSGEIEDLYRGPVYTKAFKWEWGWEESSPIYATFP